MNFTIRNFIFKIYRLLLRYYILFILIQTVIQYGDIDSKVNNNNIIWCRYVYYLIITYTNNIINAIYSGKIKSIYRNTHWEIIK